jgi:hypothetical protein
MLLSGLIPFWSVAPALSEPLPSPEIMRVLRQSFGWLNDSLSSCTLEVSMGVGSYTKSFSSSIATATVAEVILPPGKSPSMRSNSRDQLPTVNPNVCP